MRRIPQIFIVLVIFVFSILACTLPGSEPTPVFPPTPNATMTELYAQATILTPAVIDQSTKTSTSTIVPSATATFTAVNTQSENATPGATQTFTPVSQKTLSTPQRSAGLVSAKFLSKAPVIDGDWGEWNTTQYGANIVVFGADKWTDGDDLEAAYRIGWDDNNLYLAVKIRDDKYVQNATGADLYKGDSVELLLDADLYGDYSTASLNSDDYQLGISLGESVSDGTRESYLWFPSSAAGKRSKVVIDGVVDGDVYRVEASIPWSVFGITPSTGKHFGFAVSINDNDNSSSNVQQSMVSSSSKRRLTDPTTWNELLLTN